MESLNTKSNGVLGIGAVSVDRFLVVNDLPGYDEKVNGIDHGWFAGGMCANFAVAARRSGSRAGLVTVFGDDDEGAEIHRRLIAAGVEVVAPLISRGKRSWWCVALLDKRAEKALVVVETDLPLPSPESLSVSILSQWGIVYPLTQNMPWCTSMSQIAKKAGCLVALDLEPDFMRREWDALHFKDLGGLSDVAFMKAACVQASGYSSSDDLCEELLKLGVQVVIVTDGENPVTCYSYGKKLVATPPTVTVRDTTGAGDAFGGAFCSAFVRELDLEVCLREATALATLSVTAVGSQSYLSEPDEVIAKFRSAVSIQDA
jgi:ribokinase